MKRLALLAVLAVGWFLFVASAVAVALAIVLAWLGGSGGGWV